MYWYWKTEKLIYWSSNKRENPGYLLKENKNIICLENHILKTHFETRILLLVHTCLSLKI